MTLNLAYSTGLVVSVVGNAPKLSSIKYMQDMTSGFCASVVEGDEAQLEDKRDGNKYWVGKMLDGKCWMLQNLALDLSTSITLTPDDTNITADWKPSKSTSNDVSTSMTSSGDIGSWNLGKWALATPYLRTTCANDSTGQSISNCVNVGFVDVSDATKFQPTYVATTGNWEGANTTNDTLVAVNCTSWSGSGTSKKCTAGTYDPHYLIGNYYTWYAAIASTNNYITSGQASGSICPNGWKLPMSNTANDGSFARLLSQYGLESSAFGTGTDGKTYNIAGAPLRFVRAGYVYSANRYLYAPGRDGYYWSSTPTTDSGIAYYLTIANATINPAGSRYRFFGSSVRCIAQ